MKGDKPIKNRRPGSMELQVFKEPRTDKGRPYTHLYTKPARTVDELAGLVRKALRSGIRPRCLMMVRYDKDVTKIRWVPDEWSERTT